MAKRTRDSEELEKEWSNMFGYPPYTSQIELLSLIKEHTDSTKPLIIEAPTGSGKSSIGLFLGYLTKHNEKRRIDYICSTTNLQTQLLKDVLNIPQFRNSVEVLFGRQRYFCIHLINDFMNQLEDLKVNQESKNDIRNCLDEFKKIEFKNLDTNDKFWTTPMRTQMKDFFNKLL